jgi:hypothetical protein
MGGRKISVGQWLWNYSFLILVCFYSVMIPSCKKTDKQKAQSAESPKSAIPVDQNQKPLPADFIEFYKKFHSDSAFQMQHIAFPLKGMPNFADPEDMKENEFYFTADQWIIQKQGDPNKNEMSYINLGDVAIEERIQEKENKLIVIRRFGKTFGEWNLIYYAGLNKYKVL